MRWEPYNKDPSFLCGVPGVGDERKGYHVLAVHESPCSEVPGEPDHEHERLIERIAAGLNLLSDLQHEVGNPVFAIETNLDPLRKRIKDSQEISGRSNKLSEALEIVDEIQASLEKIKAAIAARLPS